MELGGVAGQLRWPATLSAGQRKLRLLRGRRRRSPGLLVPVHDCSTVRTDGLRFPGRLQLTSLVRNSRFQATVSSGALGARIAAIRNSRTPPTPLDHCAGAPATVDDLCRTRCQNEGPGAKPDQRVNQGGRSGLRNVHIQRAVGDRVVGPVRSGVLQ